MKIILTLPLVLVGEIAGFLVAGIISLALFVVVEKSSAIEGVYYLTLLTADPRPALP